MAQLKGNYPDATAAGISPDLSCLDSVRTAFREAAYKCGCEDILVNNAGVSEDTLFIEYTKEIFDKVIDPMLARIPLKRPGEPEDNANAFAFLASDEARYVTGAVLSEECLART